MARDGGFNRGGNLEDSEFVETVVKVKPVSKVTKGGRDRRFNALVVVGDKKGRVGVGMGKAREVSEAIRKGTQIAQRSIQRVSVGSTIPHEVWGKCGAGLVFLRPATPGTGLIAGSAARAVLEAAGVQNVLSKCVGSANALNVARATISALAKLRTFSQVRVDRRLYVPAEPVAPAAEPTEAVGENVAVAAEPVVAEAIEAAPIDAGQAETPGGGDEA
jgi:small subunit ribosomal protein S5